MGVVFLQFLDQFFDVLAFGVSIHRAWIFTYWKLVLIFKSDNICFRYENHRTYYSQIHPVQIGVGRKTVKASFIKRDIIIVSITSLFMMGIGDFIASQFFGFFI